MKWLTGKNTVLLLFVLYCLDLAWKLAHWHQMVAGLEWWIIAAALTVRFAVMAGLWIGYQRMPQRESSNTAKKSV